MSLNIFHTLIMILILGIIITYVIIKKEYSSSKKIMYLLTSLGFIIYSGISTLYKDLCEEYFMTFIIYFLSFTIGFILLDKLRLKRKNNLGKIKCQLDNVFCTEDIITDNFLKLMVVLYFLYIIVQFIYPTNKLANLIHIDLSLTEAFANRGGERGNIVYQLFYYINMGAKPFFYIYLHRLMKRKKYGQAYILYLAYFYLGVALNQYMARSGALVEVLFLMLMAVSQYEDKIKFKRVMGIFMGFGVIFITLIPIMLAYESYRLGAELNINYSSDAVFSLIYKETDFGKHYEFCKNHFSLEYLRDFFVWIFTLPLPSVLFTFKKGLFLVNTGFSEMILGVKSTDPGYYVLLPSIMGEALLVFGPYIYWAHGFLIGGFINRFCASLEKNKEFTVLQMYFAAQFLLMGRGGTGSVLPQAINIVVFYLFIMCSYRIYITYLRKAKLWLRKHGKNHMKKILIISFLSKETEGRLKRHYDSLGGMQNIQVKLIQGERTNSDFSENENVINVKLPFKNTVLNLFYFYVQAIVEMRKKEYDYVFLNNYYTAFLALFICKNKLIYDAYELYYPGCGKKFTCRDWFFYVFERKCIKKAKVTLAANEARSLVMTGVYRLNEIPIAILNTPDEKVVHTQSYCDKKFAIVYAGYLSDERKIRDIIDAVLKFNEKKNSMLELHIYGKGPLDGYVKNVAESFGCIKFFGEYKNSQLSTILPQYKYGYVCYDNDEINTKLCSPNKLYDYLRSSVVIISNQNFSIAKFIKENGVGVCNDDYLKAIESLVKNYATYLNNVDMWNKKQLDSGYGSFVEKINKEVGCD